MSTKAEGIGSGDQAQETGNLDGNRHLTRATNNPKSVHGSYSRSAQIRLGFYKTI